MTPRIPPRANGVTLPSLWLAGAVMALVISACSRDESVPVTQAVAKVNKSEITELQVNQILERQRGLAPEQVDSASQRIVAALVDQEIVYQKARDLKLDRDPRVVQAVESARRELVSRAYLERIAEGAAAPSIEEIRSYFDSKPALFRNRRIYSLQELAVDAPPERRAEIEGRLTTLKSPVELEAYVKEQKLQVRSERSTVPAESLPLALVDRLSAIKPGTGLVVPAPTGLRVIYVSSTQDAPVTLEQARPIIETYLLNERKRVTIEHELQTLRSTASVEYLGKFKALAASAAGTGSASNAAPATPAAPAEIPASGSDGPMDAATLNKGMSGLK